MSTNNSAIPIFVLEAFGCPEPRSIEPLGSGNINDTFKVVTDTSVLVFQKINTNVFKDPTIIEKNISLVSHHLATNYSDYVFPHPLETVDGKTMVYDDTNVPWRVFLYFNDTISYNVVPTAEYAYKAAFAFADFSRRLSGINVASLRPTIPDFHNLTLREAQFAAALLSADNTRLEIAKETITEYQQFSWIGEQYRQLLETDVYLLRIHHHDTKVNNILFKETHADVVTIVDLDTIMPGYLYSDVGDLLMFGTSVFEDVTNLDDVIIDIEKWNAILKGYTDGFAGELTPGEVQLLPFSGLIMCYMLGLRFLTDYLNGEVYFKARYPGQNFDKAKNRLKLLKEMSTLVDVQTLEQGRK